MSNAFQIVTSPTAHPRCASVPHTRAEWHRAYRAAVAHAKRHGAVVAVDLPDGRVAHVSGERVVRDPPQMVERIHVARW